MKTIQIKKYGIRHTSPTFCNAGGVSVFPYGEANSPILVPCGCIMRMGVTMDFRQVMKRYFVESDYGIVALWAFDKTTIRKNYSSKIYNIVEVPNRKTKN